MKADTQQRNGKEMPKVFLSLQAVRGLAALAVVLYHCESIGSLPKYWHWSRHLYGFGGAGVYFFFVLSGIVILHAHRADIGTPERLASYAWKRFRRIYPIYWVVLIALLPLYLMLPAFRSSAQTKTSVIAESFLLLPVRHAVTVLPVAWTLYHEVIFYLVFSFLLVKRNLGSVVLAAWLLASAAALAHPPQNQVFDTYISPLHLLFGMGLLVLLAVRRYSFPGVPFALLGLLACGGLLFVQRSAENTSMFFALVCGAAAAVTLFGLMLSEKRHRLPVPRFLGLLGDASYALYLVHFPVALIAARVTYALWKRHPVSALIPFLALFLIASAAGIATHLFIEKPLLQRLSRRRSSSLDTLLFERASALGTLK